MTPSPHLWQDCFPNQFLPDIFQLVIDGWRGFGPCDDWHEEKINRRLAREMQKIKSKSEKFLPFLINAEQYIGPDDHLTKSRLDICISGFDESNYFAFECKKLKTSTAESFTKYTGQGMSRFVQEQYAEGLDLGGMLGYVMDGICTEAFSKIEMKIKAQAHALKCQPPGLHKSAVHDCCFESYHPLPHKRLTLFHIFLSDPTREPFYEQL